MHTALHLLAAGVVGVVVLALGVCVHELLHAVPLALADVEYTVTVLPDDDPAGSSPDTVPTAVRNAVTGSLVRVEVTHLPTSTPEWVVRGAALLPVALALPLALVAAGALPDPLAAGDAVGTAALVAVTACRSEE